MKNPPPASIRILHLDWEIIFVDPSVAEQAEAFGWTDKVRQKIFLQSNLKPRCLAETALHEAFHAIFSSCGMSNELGEEEACSMLSGPLLFVLDANPAFRKWLFELMAPPEDFDDSAYV